MLLTNSCFGHTGICIYLGHSKNEPIHRSQDGLGGENTIDISAKQTVPYPYLLHFELIKNNHSNWSCFKQTFERSSGKPIDRHEKQSDQSCDANSSADARQTKQHNTTNSATRPTPDSS